MDNAAAQGQPQSQPQNQPGDWAACRAIRVARGQRLHLLILPRITNMDCRASLIRYRAELLPWKDHIRLMGRTKRFTDTPDKAWVGSVIDLAGARRVGRVRPVAASTRQAATGLAVDAVEDNWVDEYQWLSGFPSRWGDRGGGWFRGF